MFMDTSFIRLTTRFYPQEMDLKIKQNTVIQSYDKMLLSNKRECTIEKQ